MSRKTRKYVTICTERSVDGFVIVTQRTAFAGAFIVRCVVVKEAQFAPDVDISLVYANLAMMPYVGSWRIDGGHKPFSQDVAWREDGEVTHMEATEELQNGDRFIRRISFRPGGTPAVSIEFVGVAS